VLQGAIARAVEPLNTAPLPDQVRAAPDGPQVRRFEVVPEGPAEQ
jgi:hypothetical protein